MFQNKKKPSFLSKIKSGLLGFTKRHDSSKPSFISFVRRTPRRTIFSSVFTLILLLGGAVALRLTQQPQDVRQQAFSIDFCERVSTISWAECAALVDLYKYTGGTSWKINNGWLVTSDPCSADQGWYGVTCVSTSTTQFVSEIKLDSNNLSGVLPENIESLKNLSVLSLSGNNLIGTIPTNIGNLSSLNVLNFSNNQLEGSIPISIEKIPNLNTFFWKEGNNLCLPFDLDTWYKQIPSRDTIDSSSYCGSISYSHRSGDDWCQNHGGIVATVDHDVSNWTECLAWCDTVMNQSKPLCQYNADNPRNCWVNYAPGGANGDINQCYWIPGTPPFGAWWIGFEDQSTIPTVSPTTPPSENNVGQVVGYVFFDKNSNGVHDCNVVTKVGNECEWPSEHLSDAWKWTVNAVGPTSTSANTTAQYGWYQTPDVPYGDYTVTLNHAANQTKTAEYTFTTQRTQTTHVGTTNTKSYVNGRVDFGVLAVGYGSTPTATPTPPLGSSPTPTTPPSQSGEGQVVGYVFFDSNENGVHDCNVVTKVGAECQWPAGKYYDDAWKWRITASGPTTTSANSSAQVGWYQTGNVPLGNYVVSLGDVAGQTKAEQYKFTTPQIQNTVVGTNAQKTYVNGRVDYGVIPISMSTGTSPCSIADRADINCDGQINMTDYNLLINSFTF